MCDKSLVRVSVEGYVLMEGYQVCKLLAETLHRHHGKRFAAPHLRGYLEADWVERLGRLQMEEGGQAWTDHGGVVAHVDGQFVGSRAELLDRFKEYDWRPPSKETIKEMARREYLGMLSSSEVLYAWMTLQQGLDDLGTLLLQLRADLLPKSCAWFAMLCEPSNHVGVTYKGSLVHRVCRGGWLQAGQVSVSDRNMLDDETFCYPHDRRGVLSFTNDGPNTNLTQFLITFQPAPWMDGQYVAFGRVVEGWDVLRKVELTPCTYDSPDLEITIEDCGIVDVGLGRSIKLVSTLRFHALTVGQPHIDLGMFVDLLLDKFCEILFNRMDPEVKRRLDGKWIAGMLWVKVRSCLTNREPPLDIEDPKDRSSNTLLVMRYLEGLYGPPDVPDHYIKGLLEDVVGSAVERCATMDMVRSVVRMLVNTAESVAVESCAEPVVDSLLEALLDTVMGLDPIGHIASSLYSQMTGGTVSSVSVEGEVITSGSRESLTLFILDMLFTAVRNAALSI